MDLRVDLRVAQNFHEQPFGVDRRAQVAHRPREHLIVIVHQLHAANRGREAGLLRLADLIADLAIELIPQRRFGGGQRQHHRHLVPLRRQRGEPLIEMTQLDVLPAARRREPRRFVDQRLRHGVIGGDDAAVVHERQRDGEPPEQPRVEDDEREDADDFAAGGRGEVDGAMTEGAREDVAPRPLVIARRGGMTFDERIPGRGLRIFGDGDRRGTDGDQARTTREGPSGCGCTT